MALSYPPEPLRSERLWLELALATAKEENLLQKERLLRLMSQQTQNSLDGFPSSYFIPLVLIDPDFRESVSQPDCIWL